MIFTAVGLFLTGALFGFYMFARHLRRRAVPAWAAVAHGAFGATAFGLVLLLMVRMPEVVLIRAALTILIAAIVLGVVNLLFHVRRVRHRTILIVMHALAAVSGVGTLAYAGLFAIPGESPNPSQPGPAPSGTGAPVAMAATLASAPKTTATAGPEATTAAAPAATPPTPAPAATAATAPKPSFPTGPAWTDRPLTFENASAALDSQAQSNLAHVAEELAAHSEIKLVEVQGHTDERGDPAGNARLARTRASAVADFLAAKGIARSRLRVAGYGSACPADPSCQGPSAPTSCHDGSSYPEDRRVTLVVLESGGARLHGNVTCDAGMRLAPQSDRSYAGP